MIILHESPDASAASADIAAALDDLVVAYTRQVSDPNVVPVSLPAIEEGDRWISGPEVAGYLEELRSYLGAWRKFQSDACYIHDDGTIC